MNNKFLPDSPAIILIVDDTTENLRLLQNILSTSGYKVRAVKSGEHALKTVDFAQPDLILLDVKMPEMNGYEVCQKLKEQEKTAKIPVIFISAFDDKADRAKAFEVGGIDYITKPFEIKEVLIRVNHQIMLIQQQKQLIALQKQLDDALKQLQQM